VSVLVVAPHPDDAELGAWSLLSGATILCLTHGGAVDPRGDEARRAAKISAARLIACCFPDGELTVTPGLVARIEHAIEATGAEVVAGPPLSDEHQDHAAAARAVRAATRRTPLTVLEYETPSTPPGWEPDTYMPLSAASLAERERALGEFASQAGRPYMAPETARARAAVRGQRVGLSAAEAFRTVRRVGV